MGAFYKIIISDYKQRTRSYAFLVALAISLYAAYSFVPAPDAAYNTVRVGNYIGVQNAAWIGYVTAMMSSIFLSWIGFYLVNSGIKKDIDTGVGSIIATTAISNFSYLLAKTWSNFLVLLTIVGCVFLMAITLFFIRSGAYPFQISQFILPYLFITIPAIFFTAALAVVAEVFLYRYTIVMNIAYFIFFCTVVSMQVTLSSSIDIIGSKPVFAVMQQTVFQQSHDASQAVSMGFMFGSKRHFHYFEFHGIRWTVQAIFSRVILVCFALLLVFISSRFFHRFEIRQKFRAKKKSNFPQIIAQVQPLHDIKLSALPPIVLAYGIMPFIKTELLMLFRKGPRWLWFINLGGMIALIFAPLTIAHQMVLPILWFLQVGRWSDLATKEKTNRIHYFTYASYKPLGRLLPAQIIAGIVLALALAFPLLLRYLVGMQFLPILSIIMGAIFIVLFAVAFGILSGGKKLFEILFFLFAYANIEKIPFLDYFGGMNQGINYTLLIAGFIGFFALLSFMLRRMEIRRV
jgi:hypothetical protein